MLYLDMHYFRHRVRQTWFRRIVFWIPSVSMLIYGSVLAVLAWTDRFIPENPIWVTLYLWLIGLWIFPKFVFSVCSFLGWRHCKFWKKRYNWGNLVGIVLGFVAALTFIYGSIGGVRRLQIRHVDVYLNDLPAAFNGYRIVQFSDAHVGTFADGRLDLLQRDVDSINAQRADAICFVGDLINMVPSELYKVQPILRQLKAKDGVFSVLGNHDYAFYTHFDPAIEAANCKETISRQRQMGWKLLLNEHVAIERGNDKIYIAGMEDLGESDSVKFGDVKKTIENIPVDAFTIMLSHDPWAWRNGIFDDSNAQLTLSGHTHGGQVSLFGVRPTMFKPEDFGLYERDRRYLNVTCGIGGVLPFRLGVYPEIVVLTLHRK